ncbi:MAG: Gfo/Idh/MocA family oxidoreductase [Actinomycetota bacterium]
MTRGETGASAAAAARPGQPTVGVGMVGYAFMGAAHSQGWRTVGRVFDLPVVASMNAICGRDAERVAAAAAKLGWASYETEWKDLIGRDDIQLVDVCTPGSSHAEIAIAALDAGKHVFCEKPLANSVEEAKAMVEAAERAQRVGVRSMVAFNYRRVPALVLARQLIAAGRLGTIRHVRAVYLQDWLVDPNFPLVWRLQADQAGSGALSDLGAHLVDAAQFLIDDRITGVSALTETFVKERPLSGASSGLAASAAGSEKGAVTVDDAAVFIARFAGGALGSFEATRFGTGRKNGMRIEVNGDGGTIAFEFESMNELQFYDSSEPAAAQGFRRILVTESEHPYMSAWWPPGHIIGYEHTFTHEIRDLLEAIGTQTDPTPSFADGLVVQQVLAAVSHSAENEAGWTPVASD